MKQYAECEICGTIVPQEDANQVVRALNTTILCKGCMTKNYVVLAKEEVIEVPKVE